MKRTIKFELEVTVSAMISEEVVERALNQALNEPPCDWGNWIVGAVTVVSRRKHAEPARTPHVAQSNELGRTKDL